GCRGSRAARRRGRRRPAVPRRAPRCRADARSGARQARRARRVRRGPRRRPDPGGPTRGPHRAAARSRPRVARPAHLGGAPVILPFTLVQLALACLVGLVCVVLGLIGRKPNDLPVRASVFAEVLLLAQSAPAMLAPGLGHPPGGSPLAFWLDLVSAAVIPPLAIVWALVERTRWSNVVLGAAAFAVAVMLWRMEQI